MKDRIFTAMNEKTSIELTQEQIDMIQMFADGYTREDVAEELDISIRTVEDRCGKILAKMGCKSIVGVVVLLFRNGLIK